MNTRWSILHVDMDAFYASIEQRDRPELRGRPVLVGHDGPRGVVATASYEARPFGCHSAQAMAVAKRLCPEAIVVTPRHSHYSDVSREVFRIFESYTSQVEPLSIDEAFLDVTGSRRLHGSAHAIAESIRRRLVEEVQLTGSVGVAPNKFLAKLASESNKPNGLTLVDEDDVQSFLQALPVERMWGVGPRTAERLRRVGIRTFLDLQLAPLDMLRRHSGNGAERIKSLAQGADERHVVSDREAKSVSQEQTFGSNLQDCKEVRSILMRQVDQVAARLRRHDLRGRTLTIKIRSGEFMTLSRSITLEESTNTTLEMRRAAATLFDKWAASEFFAVRLIGFGCSGFESRDEQPGLFEGADRDRQSTIDSVVDRINERFGQDSIRRADV